MSKGGKPMRENYFFQGKDALPLKMICYQMSRCKLTKGKIALALKAWAVLNRSNISSEETVLLKNNNKVSLVFDSYMK